VGFSNTALTGSTALTQLGTLFTYYWATAAGAFAAPTTYDLAGFGAVIPGNEFCIGASSALTSATWDVSVYWEEVPYLVSI